MNMQKISAIPNQKARDILGSIKYATIATVSETGEPWNTPVAAFHFKGDYVLYWASWQQNQHSQNIRQNGRAYIVVYDSTPLDDAPSVGVYMMGEAHEITDREEVMRAALVFSGDPYNSSDGKEYLGNYPRRIYKFVPSKIWMNGDGEIEGNFVDIRVGAEELLGTAKNS